MLVNTVLVNTGLVNTGLVNTGLVNTVLLPAGGRGRRGPPLTCLTCHRMAFPSLMGRTGK